MARRITVEVAADGTIRAKTEGIAGPDCMKELPLIQSLINGTIEDSRLTADYYQEHAEDQQTASQQQREEGK